MRNDFSNWLNQKYLEWQIGSGGRKTISEFADYLNIPRSVVNHYLNGRTTPKRKNTEKIATKLGPEAYDLMGFQRPDPEFKEIRRIYDKATEVEKIELKRIFRDWAADRGYTVTEQQPKSDLEI